MGRCYISRSYRSRSRLAKPANFAHLYCAQKPALYRKTHLAQLIEEQSSVTSRFYETNSIPHCTRKRSPGMSKEFGVE